MTDQIVVLGWDALDAELIDKYGLTGSFGEHRRTIETYVNEHIGEPHTRELWPSMITGQTPPEHGIRAATGSDGVDWGNPAIATAASVANGIVPKTALTAIGKRLRERGARLDTKTVSDYDERGLKTVFGPSDRPISIPNYTTPYDERHDMDANRDDLWAELDVDRSVREGIKPQVDIETVQSVLGEALGRRLTHTLTAIESGAPIVWPWFGYIDSVGHMDPAVEYPLQRGAYELAAGVTEMVRSMVPPETIVVSISDHGLQDGHHTHYATIASDSVEPIESISAVWEIADWIDHENPTGRSIERQTASASPDEVTEDLEALGYL